MKPLGHRGYGHIPHLPGSRLGPGDHHCHEGQARICTEAPRDRHDEVIVQEKLDGSCVAAARIEGRIVAINRAGYLASSSPYVQHHAWARWVERNAARFRWVLGDGERLVGEWLALAHGTRYDLGGREPFVAFDLMRGTERANHDTFIERALAAEPPFEVPQLLHRGEPLPLAGALAKLGTYGHHGALDPAEGVVYRVERKGKVDFLAKYVRHDKSDGCLLPELNDGVAHWNWSES